MPSIARRRTMASICVVALVLAACGDDADDGQPAGNRPEAGSPAADIDACALISDEQMDSLTGEVLPAESFGPPDSPFVGCSWNTGSVLVQLDVGADSLVFAPGQECPALDLGDEGAECPGSVQFLANGIRVIVSTDGFAVGGEPVDPVAVATALEPEIEALS